MAIKPTSQRRVLGTYLRVPRLTLFLVLSALLFVASLYVTKEHQGSLLAVSLYKMHLVSIGGWGAYWLDRSLFPYARPHDFLADEDIGFADTVPVDGLQEGLIVGESLFTNIAGLVMIRRALITLGVLLCVGLGA